MGAALHYTIPARVGAIRSSARPGLITDQRRLAPLPDHHLTRVDVRLHCGQRRPAGSCISTTHADRKKASIQRTPGETTSEGPKGTPTPRAKGVTR